MDAISHERINNLIYLLFYFFIFIVIVWASQLYSLNILEAGMYSSIATRAAELRKHSENDMKCAELCWKCIKLSIYSQLS